MGKVLIIEDDALIAKVYKTRLEKDGHTVITADDGEKGLQAVKNEAPEVILLDIMMPKISGLDLLEQLKSNTATAKIPVLVYSNLARLEEVEKAKKLGAEEFLSKSSLSPQQVVAKIEKFL
ncbi:PleD family two-component system response regulator [Patescibacteria group bacterium]